MDPRCPRPDKLAFDTEEEAADRYKSLLLTDQTMRVYRCACRRWHAGRHEDNVEKNTTIVNAPTIRTGLNQLPEPVNVPRRRRPVRDVHRSSAVTTLTVDKAVWTNALAIAGGDSARIEVLDEHNVKIHNNGKWRKRRK